MVRARIAVACFRAHRLIARHIARAVDAKKAIRRAWMVEASKPEGEQAIR